MKTDPDLSSTDVSFLDLAEKLRILIDPDSHYRYLHLSGLRAMATD
jgi:hypothetical protein